MSATYQAKVEYCDGCKRWQVTDKPHECHPPAIGFFKKENNPYASLAGFNDRVREAAVNPSSPSSAAAILQEAASLVGGDRARTHGDKAKNMAAIAAVWNGYLQARKLTGHCEDLDGHDVANLMEMMKVARRLTGSFNRDDYVDGAGYAGVAGEVKAGEVAK